MKAGNGRNTVLVVDDEPQVLAAIEDALEHEFRVVVETSPQAAIQILESEPDLSAVLTDQRMPEMSGDEFLAKARDMSTATRILITGYADLDAVIRAVNLGKIFAYISKPWDQDQLKLVIYKAVEHYRLQRDLSEEQRLLHNLMDNIPDAVYFKDVEHRFVRLNKVHAARLGVGRPQDAIGRTIRDFAPPDQASEVETEDAEILLGGRTVTDRLRRLDVSPGKSRWLSTTKAPIKNDRGQVVGLVGISRDITERQEAGEKIRRLNRVYAVLSGINSLIIRVRNRQELFQEACRIAVEHGNFGLAWISAFDPATLDVTPVAWAGIDAGEHVAGSKSTARADVPLGQGVIGRAIREKNPAVCNDVAAEPDVGSPKRKEAIRSGYRSLIALPLLVEGSAWGTLTLYAREPNYFTEDEVKLLTELAGDISFALEHIGKQEKLNYLAYYDALTGLPNRTLFHDRVAQQIHASRQGQGKLAVVIGDVMRLRLINDTLGRHAGDALLREFAARLKQSWPESENVGRVAGDDFCGLLTNIKEISDVAHQFETTMASVTGTPFTLDGKELTVVVTAGIALFPSDGEDTDALLRNAEAALRKAKAQGERYLFYQPEMNASVARTLTLENKLRKALGAEQFVLHYQPKIELASGRLSGLEALIRWNDPESGLVSPMQFIPLLEETGMILEAGRWALQKALAHHHEWHIQGLQPPRIAVNVSPMQLRQKNFVEVVREAIEESTTGSPGLDLEITESLIMEDIERNIEKLRAIRNMGVNIAIDDFGTGYSSLGYLTKLPVNALKIDRAFIVNMVSSPDSMGIVQAIISLARSLRFKVIAEGVDSEEQVKLLRLLRCDEVQGFHFSQPLPPEKAVALLRTGR